MQTVFIYHGGCFDGFTCAWAYQRWVARPEDETHYIAGTYGEGLALDHLAGAHVIIADFSYPRAFLERIHDVARSVLVLDHHKTAMEDLVGLSYAYFDVTRSGAGLVWDELIGGPRHWLIDYIEDRDLWRHELPWSQEVSAVVSATKMDFLCWSELADKGDPRYPDNLAVRVEGTAILKYMRQYGLKAIEQATFETFRVGLERYPAWTMNLPYMNCSEHVGSLLDGMGGDFAAGYFRRKDGRWQFSLRSKPHFDVTKIAKAFGGGGHAQAAGFDVAKLEEVFG